MGRGGLRSRDEGDKGERGDCDIKKSQSKKEVRRGKRVGGAFLSNGSSKKATLVSTEGLRGAGVEFLVSGPKRVKGKWRGSIRAKSNEGHVEW